MSSVSLNTNEIKKQVPNGEMLNALMMKALKNGGGGGGGGNSGRMAGGRKPDTSETGSSNGGNNSDNSALVSLGNTSFGFNFDSEESNSKEGQNDSNEDSDGNVNVAQTNQRPTKGSTGSTTNGTTTSKKRSSSSRAEMLVSASSLSSSNLGSSSHGGSSSDNAAAVEQVQAAADAVASLESIARSYPTKQHQNEATFTEADNAEAQRQALDRKRKAEQEDPNIDKDADSGGYNTDDDEEEAQSSSRHSRNDKNGLSGSTKPSSKRKYKAKENENKREERNQREKERSFRISKQITELRDLLASGGVVVPKGTKSSVLTEAATYIRLLQQHQYRSEIDRHQLVQQLQQIGGGAHGPQAAAAVRHFAAQNGVWTLGNFGGVPPKSAMTCVEPTSLEAPTSSTSHDPLQQTKVDASEYRFIFNSCGAGIAIASMGGAFIDCNQLFCQLTNSTKQEVCGLTLFNLTARQDLQKAFDQISRLISPPMEVDRVDVQQAPKPIILRGAMKHRDDLGMSVALVKGDDGIAKCFCVTLVKNPTSPFDTSRPVPATFDAIKPVSAPMKEGDNNMHIAPAFTSG